MNNIRIKKIGITELNTDCIVNAANSGLAMGSGVCGAIFRAAGPRKMQAACDRIGHCPTGGAVITPGFALKAKYVIHAVGPVWRGGNDHEPQHLYSCYRESLDRAKENDCHSIGFPLISSGIFGYPKDGAWRAALQSCSDWTSDNPDYDIDIIFAVLDDQILELGQSIMHAEALKNAIKSCGLVGVQALNQEAGSEQYRDKLLEVLELMKTVTADEIRAAAYPANIQNTLLMDRHLIEDTVTEELDQLSLLNTVVTYIECNAEGMPEHSAKYMDRVTDLRKILESVYEKEAMRFCGSDGC